MKQALAYGDFFEAAARRRGKAYFDECRVVLVNHNVRRTDAVVQGSGGREYNVQIRWEDDEPEMSCDCPRFDDGYNCKHLYATLLEVDAYRDGFEVTARERPSARRRSPSGWAAALARLREAVTDEEGYLGGPPTVPELMSAVAVRCWYLICLGVGQPGGPLPLRLCWSEPTAEGGWTPPSVWRELRGRPSAVRLVEAEDQRILAQYDASGLPYTGGLWRRDPVAENHRGPVSADMIAAMAATGRLAWTLDATTGPSDHHPLTWDDGPPWRLVLSLTRAGGSNGHTMLAFGGYLKRGDESASLADVVMGFSDGLILFPDRIARLDGTNAAWIAGLCMGGPTQVPLAECDEFLAKLVSLPGLPELQLDPSIDVVRSTGQPSGIVELSRSDGWSEQAFRADVSFLYEGQAIHPDYAGSMLWSASGRQMIERDRVAEQALLHTLSDLGFRAEPLYYEPAETLFLQPQKLPRVVPELVERGWEVRIDRQSVRSASSFRIQLRGEQDWFDIDAQVDFGEYSAGVMELLAAVRARSRFITLGDGSQAMLPEELVQRLGKLAKIGDETGNALRVHRTQALLIDMLLADQPDVSVQRDFTELCRKMRGFSGIKPAPAPRGFRGELRRYQSEGLGWFGFLRDFGFGGCLADDMGLGKTVQVLALLQSRRVRRLKAGETRLPSLVVVPKSLVYNWISEADRFAPQLTIINHTGTQRIWNAEALDKADVLLTTYGTLRSDIERLSQQQFDYAILDEAQAIKNAASQTAKACRLIRAQNRLVMTGTPVENHLGELWSLLDFLNPGMIGAGRCRQLSQLRDQDSETCELLRQSLRPFILRRTKEQVLQDLPEKVEETIYCEMSPKQQRLYDDLRNYYRVQLTQKIGQLGIQKSKIHVLEALLRLRQAACDPRLVDPKRPVGVKLEVLCERLQEVISEGHKALVFSQFTSLLALLRQELDKRNWVYEYLDGKTQQRARRVQRFQEDGNCPLFLISLKAGGQGLNLTAADYVFILDPWWNPAVEAQAIDRAHRIGQTRQVMAYRIICRNSVEEKIIALQQSKRELADAIITANESLIRQLSVDDLELLLT